MQKRFKISVDGRGYDVIVEEVPMDGAVAAPPPMATASAVAHAEAVAAPVAPRAPVAAGSGAQTAPLSGVVESILVSVGQQVAVGDVVAVIEAMKMKTEIVCRAAGAVVAIPVTVGEAVDAGTVLVEIG